uniref:Elongation of very long chain fatty acids protein n=1 Tax=Platychelipus littoralis TaxID=2593136 RepID=A0A9E8LRE3_9MAXI|nr:fatty acid elongase elovl1d [Platychelipus littoralis]
MLDVLVKKVMEYQDLYNEAWKYRDQRVDGWPLMSSPYPTIFICALYVYIVKVAGPNYMKDKEPMNLKYFLMVYNVFQVVLSAYIFVELLKNGWGGDYSFRCQPVDFSNNPKALKMVFLSWLYFASKFVEFIDTFCFVLRKKFSQVSLLHVIHHGIMPLAVWPGLRFVPGGHASFFGLLNTFVHILMYTYYFVAALGPRYQRFIWWKRYLTNLQMIQFVFVFFHSFQLIFYEDCDFPVLFAYWIAGISVMFFVLFSQFYIQTYLTKYSKKKVT